MGAQKAEIYGGNCLQHAHAAGAVSKAMMAFQGNAPSIIKYPQQIPASGFKMHGHTRIMDIRLHKRAGPVIRLQITPEKPLMDADLIGGETLQGDIHRFLKYVRLYVLLQKDGKPVNGRKVPSLQCGVYNSGKIQPVPVLRGISGRLAAFIICTHMKCHRLYSFL